MRDFNETNATEAVLSRMSGAGDARFRTVMSSVVRHLHAVAREVEPTPAEWAAAIAFLTETGKMCDDKRQEFILLSDTLGVSMLLDAIWNRKPAGATESTVLGPFHVAGAPVRKNGANICLDGKGEPCVVSGRVLDPAGKPIAGASLDVWQTNDEGFYDVQQPDDQPEMNLRGRFASDRDGAFWFRSVRPVSYPIPSDGPVGRMLEKMGRHPWRPAHIHFIVSAAGFEPVTTHLFAEGDAYLESDAVFGVKDSLVKEFVRDDSAAAAKRWKVPAPFWRVSHDFSLAPAAVKTGKSTKAGKAVKAGRR